MQNSTDQLIMRSIPASAGLEIVAARFRRYAFTPHRHDDYVIGITRYGAQKFRYRGQERCVLPGQAFIIHPDERHDGRPGTESGYGYHAAYIQPQLISEAIGNRPLPFVAEVVSQNPRLINSLEDLLTIRFDDDEDLHPVGALIALANLLAELAGQALAYQEGVNHVVINRFKDQFQSDPAARVQLSQLEADYGLDRFTITRQFQRYFGTSPHRFLLMRRLALVKQMMLAGTSLVDAAARSGFADQSHLTRHFRRAFGITPGLSFAA